MAILVMTNSSDNHKNINKYNNNNYHNHTNDYNYENINIGKIVFFLNQTK